MKKSLLAVCLCLTAIFALSPIASAQDNRGTGQALEIAPPIITLSGNPGETIRAQLSLRDVSATDLVVTSQLDDFIAAGEDGTPKILMGDEADKDNEFSLKGWIDSLPTFTIKPREIKNLPVVINIPANASPGGHYGVIRFTATPPGVEGNGVSLSTSLGALVLINVNGDAKESLGIEEFFVSKDGKRNNLFETTPLLFTQRLKNTGNTHIQPAGQVVITDMFGKKIAAVNVNLPPRNVLPQSIRKFEQPLDKAVIGNKKLFGRYTAELKLTYGSSKQTVSQKVTFWVIPYKLIAALVILLIAGFFALRFGLKRYNQRIISKASGAPKSKKTKNKKK